MSKISELSDGGSLVSTDYLIAVRSGGNVKVRMDEINVDQIDLGDNEFIRLGNSQDLTLVHDASNSIINQAGIGDLLIQKAGSTKLTVNSTGIDVTGVITTDGLTSVGGFISIGADGAGDDFRFYGDTSGRYMEWVSAADSLLFRDGAKALFGNGSDLQIYHDGSHSYVSDQGTGNLRIYANDLVLANNDGSETFLYGVNGGGVSISYANSAKVTTTATGIDVTGTVTADGLTVETAAGTSGTIALLRNSSSASNGNAAYLDFKFDNSFSGSNVDVQIGAIKTNAGNEESAFVVKTTEGAGTPTERMRLDASGHAIIPAGVTLGTAVGTYNAANTLDDYEEGLHTVTVTPSTSGSVTLNNPQVRYTKIGNTVFISGNIRCTSVSSPVGTSIQFSLPFAIADGAFTSERIGSAIVYYDGSSDGLAFITADTGTTTYVKQTIDASTIADGDQWRFNFFYVTS